MVFLFLISISLIVFSLVLYHLRITNDSFKDVSKEICEFVLLFGILSMLACSGLFTYLRFFKT